jgi:multimeric flavodoxin WrbA
MSSVLVVKGSPRERGNSAVLAEQVAAGARAAGAHVESVYLHGMNIQPCDACDSCQAGADVDCIIDDEMQTLYPLIRQADAIVYASPIYWFTVTAQMKLFMDRCYALGGSAEGVSGHGLAGKRIGVVLTYGGDDPFDSGAVNAIRMFQDAFDYIPAHIVGFVYGCASDVGEIQKDQDVMDRAYRLGSRLGREEPV